MSSAEFSVDFAKASSRKLGSKSRDHPLLRLAREVSFPNWDVMRGKQLCSVEDTLNARPNVCHISTKPCLSQPSLTRQYVGKDERDNVEQQDFRMDRSRRDSDYDLDEFIHKQRSDSSVRSDSSSSVRSMTSSSTDESPKPSRRLVSRSHDRKVSSRPTLMKSNSVGPFFTKSPSLQLSRQRSNPIDFGTVSTGFGAFSDTSLVRRPRGEPMTKTMPTFIEVTPSEEGGSINLFRKGPMLSAVRRAAESENVKLGSLLEEDADDTTDGVDYRLMGRGHERVEKKRSTGSTDRKVKDPSHYKGFRRGSYIPDYDPVRTARKGNHLLRANSAFALNDAKLYNNVRKRMLKHDLEETVLEQEADGPGQERDPDSKFRRFINEKRHYLEKDDPNASGAHLAVNFLPTIKNGRSMSITKSLSFNTLQDVRSDAYQSDFAASGNLPVTPQKESALPGKDRMKYLTADRRHHTDVSANSSDSDNSARTSRSESRLHHSTSSERLGKLMLRHDGVIRTSSASRGLPPSFDSKRKSRLERVNSAFDGASEEYLASLNRKYEHAKRRAARINSESSADSDYAGNGRRTALALHEAVKAGNMASAQKLVANGVDVNALDEYGMPPFHYALVGGHYDCVALLLTSGANISEYFKGRRVKYFK